MDELSPPSTAAALPSHSTPGTTEDARVELAVRAQGLGYELAPHTCPQCQQRPASVVKPVTLSRPPAAVRVLESVLSVPTVLAAAMALMFLPSMVQAQHLWGMLMFFLGPSMVLSSSASLRFITQRRVRVRLGLCPSCTASLRHVQSRVRAMRRLRNMAAFGLVMLTPLSLQLGWWSRPMGVWMGAGISLAAGTLAGLALERRWRRRERALLPRLIDEDGEQIRLAVPSRWRAVLLPAPTANGAAAPAP